MDIPFILKGNLSVAENKCKDISFPYIVKRDPVFTKPYFPVLNDQIIQNRDNMYL